MKITIARTLGKMARADVLPALPALRAAMYDPDADVRLEAADALNYLRTRED